MSGFLEREPTPEQQEILKTHPFVDTYTNPQFAAYENSNWIDTLASQSRPLLASLEDKISHLGVDSLMNMAERMVRTVHFFDTDNPEIYLPKEVLYLVLLGYDLREVEDVVKTFDLVTNSLRDRFALSTRYLKGGQLTGAAKTVIAQMMQSGAKIARIPTHTSLDHYGINLRPDEENDLFKNFIDEHLSGLDEL
jgi:hypothetical protein